MLRSQRMESIGTLAGGIAHDLNNMLSPIVMGAELIKSMPDDPDSGLAVDEILRCAMRAAELVRQLLTF